MELWHQKEGHRLWKTWRDASACFDYKYPWGFFLFLQTSSNYKAEHHNLCHRLNNSACVRNQSHRSLKATEEVKVMVMRQLGNVSTHNEHNCLSQVATKTLFPVARSERPGKEKKKINKPTQYKDNIALNIPPRFNWRDSEGEVFHLLFFIILVTVVLFWF